MRAGDLCTASRFRDAWSHDKCSAGIDAALGGSRPTPLDELEGALADDDMVAA